MLLDLKPFIEREGYDLSQLDDNAVRDFTTADGAVFGLPRDLNVDRALLQQGHVRRGRDPVSGRHLGLGQADRGRQAADHGHRRRRHDRPVGPLHRDDRHGERLVRRSCGRPAATSCPRTARRPRSTGPSRPRGIQFLQDLIWKEKVVPDPAIFAETGDAFEQGVAAMEINGSWLVPTHEAAGHQPRHRAAPGRTRRQGDLGQPDRRRRVQPTPMPRRRPGSSPSTSPAPRPRRRSWPSRRRCRSTRRSSPTSYPTSFDGAQVFADSPRVRPPQAVLRGLQRVHHAAPDGARRERVQRPEQDGRGCDRHRQRAAERHPRGGHAVAGGRTGTRTSVR